MKTLLPPVVFLTRSLTALPPAQIHHADEATADAFRWLLALGFPPDVAAARVLPQLFAEPGTTPGSATEFPRLVETNRAA